MKYLSAKKIGNDFVFIVHLDETQVKEDGTPAGNYVETFTWGSPPEGVTEIEYIESHKREIPLLVADMLSKMHPKDAVTLPGF